MISSCDWEVYQIVDPEDPEANGRCCLNGISPSCKGEVRVSEGLEEDVSGWTAGCELLDR